MLGVRFGFKIDKIRELKTSSVKSNATLAPAKANDGKIRNRSIIVAQIPRARSWFWLALDRDREPCWRIAEGAATPTCWADVSPSLALLSVFATSNKTCCFNRSARSVGSGRKGICSRNKLLNS